MEVSPDVYVAYPVQWLTAAVKPEYITVSLLQGSEVLCWQYLVEENVLDSCADGCHVQLPTAPALHSGEHRFDDVFGLLIHSGVIHDVVEHIDEAILQYEVFDETQQQDLYDEHWPRLPSYHLNSHEGSGSSDVSSVSEIEVDHPSLGDWRELNRAFSKWTRFVGTMIRGITYVLGRSRDGKNFGCKTNCYCQETYCLNEQRTVKWDPCRC